MLCLWDSRAKLTMDSENWPTRRKLLTGGQNIILGPLVPREKIIFLSRHIKFGLIKYFIKAFGKEFNYFRYLCNMFSQLKDEKLLSRIFDGTEICKVICENDSMGSSMTIAVRKAWMLFVEDVKNFLWKIKFGVLKEQARDWGERSPLPFFEN